MIEIQAPNILSRSQHLYLSPTRVEEAPTYMKWFNDPEIFAHMRNMDYQSTLEEQIQWVLNSFEDPNQRIFSIYYAPEDKLIGNGGIMDISWEDRKGEIGLVIGEKQYQGRGLGGEAIWLLCRYAFDILQLHNLLAEHYAHEKSSLRLFQKLGFKHFGTRRQSRRIKDRLLDVDYSDLLPEDLIDPT